MSDRYRSRSRSPRRFIDNDIDSQNQKPSRKRSRSRSRSPDHRNSDRRKPRYTQDINSGNDERPRKKRSTTPEKKTNRRHRSRSHSPRRSNAPLPSQQDTFNSVVRKSPQPEKQKPNFKTSGLLAAASNTIQTGGQKIVLKYHEPSEARKPPSRAAWRLYVFKGKDILQTIELWEQSCWLFGREAAVVDIPLEHPSCSKQHAVIQFRYIEKRNEFGDKSGKVRPYVIDLDSSNGTTVTEEAVPTGRYVELRDNDILKFGHSSREYVIQLPKE